MYDNRFDVFIVRPPGLEPGCSAYQTAPFGGGYKSPAFTIKLWAHHLQGIGFHVMSQPMTVGTSQVTLIQFLFQLVPPKDVIPTDLEFFL